MFKIGKFVRIAAAVLVGVFTGTVFAAQVWHGERFPTDVGAISGFVDDSGSSGESRNVILTSNGGDMWNAGDEGVFYWTAQRGDFELFATIPAQIPSDLNQIHTVHGKGGIMIRPANSKNAPHIMFNRATTQYKTVTETTFDEEDNEVTVEKSVPNGSKAQLFRRATWGGRAANVHEVDSQFPGEGDVRVRLVRRGNTFDAYFSTNQNFTVWHYFSRSTFADGVMPDTLLAGVAFSPNDSAHQKTGFLEFKDVVCRPLISVRASGSTVALSWNTDGAWTNEVEALTYKVERRTIETDEWTVLTDAAAETNYTDAQAEAGVSYLYRVSAALADKANTTVDLGVSSPVRVETSVTQYPFGTDGTLGDLGVTMRFSQNDELKSSLTYFGAIDFDKWTKKWLITTNDKCLPTGATSKWSGDLKNVSSAGQTQFVPTETGYHYFRISGDQSATFSINGESVLPATGWTGAIAPYYMEKGRVYLIQFTQYNGNDDSASLTIRYATSLTDNADAYDYLWFGETAATKPLPYPWASRELGDAEVHGAALFNNGNRMFTIVATGRGVGGTYDEAEYLVQDMDEEDVLIHAKVKPGDSHEAGLVMRGDLDGAASVQAAILARGENICFVTRSETGTSATEVSFAPGSTDVQYEMVLRREGGVVSAFVMNGGAWKQVGSAVSVPGLAKIGLVASSGSRTAYAEATAEEISILPAHAAPKFVLEAENETTTKVTFANGDTAAAARIAEGTRLESAYVWYDANPILPGKYKVQGSEGAPADGFGETYADSFGMGDSFHYTFADSDPRKAVVFTATPLDALGESATPVVSLAAREEPSETGTGLYEANYNTDREGPADSAPNHASIGGIPAYWSAPVDGALKHSDGETIQTQNAHVFWIGKFTPPYSTWYKFRSRTKNAYSYLTLNGTNYVTDLTRSVDAADGSVEDVRISEWVYLKGGVPLDISVMTRMCNGHANTTFGLDMLMGGENADYQEIPLTALSTTRASDSPVIHTQGASFGEWLDKDWGTKGTEYTFNGNSLVDGVVRNESKGWGFDEFNLTLLSEGGKNNLKAFGAGMTSEAAGHFFYRPMTGDFSVSCDMTIPFAGTDQWNNDRRQGVMIRRSLDSDSAFAGVFRTFDKGAGKLRTLVRSKVATAITTANGVAYNSAATRVKLVRKNGSVRIYYIENGVEVLKETLSIPDWDAKVYVGFAGASWRSLNDSAQQTVTHFQNVKVGRPKPIAFRIIVR